MIATLLRRLGLRKDYHLIRLGGQGGQYVAKVSSIDYGFLSQFHWTALRKGKRVVAVRFVKNYLTGKWGLVYMHRLIAGTPPDMTCDHVNGDALDNRRINLENVTDQVNNQRKLERRNVA